jgi:integrase
LSVDKAKALLRLVEGSEHAESVIPFLAVSLFGGLRPTEAQLLRWEFVHFRTKQIEVRAETSKTRETRFVEINPTLALWLQRFRKKVGPIVGSNFRKDWQAVREGTEFETWEKDVLRHCFGSYWLPIHRDRGRLAEEMGNSLSVVRRHYRKAIPRHTAQQFWELAPKTKPAKPTDTGKVIEFPKEVATKINIRQPTAT